MNTQAAAGFLAVLAAGAMQGVFALPMKYTKHWKWENIWLVYSTTGMLVLPWVTVWLSTTGLGEIYRQAGSGTVLAAAVFGFGWGLGCVLCGLGIVSLGIALGSSIILGLASAFGSLLPLVVLNSDRLATRSGMLTVIGVGVMLIGIAVCAAAGRAREARLPARRETKLVAGILLCVASGVLSAFLNFGFAFGREIPERAHALGNSALASVYPLLAVVLSAGYLANAAYCGLLLMRNRSWSNFGAPAARGHWLLGVLMGLLVFGGILLYGVGAEKLGPLGTSAGWGLTMAMMIVAANASGFLTGEWKDAGPVAIRRMIAGGAVLLLAIVILGAANSVS
ncbi:MAG: hypothetical protein NTY38_03645 [Acidobacteria bacterium]|nr:hypothetical protein [Acidobacteriota bacterium]